MTFLFVYIRDAGHPDAGAPLADDPDRAVTDPDARLRFIRKELEFYNIPFPVLFDAGGEVERAYDAYPQRLIVVGTDGKVAYDGGRGTKGGPSDWDLEEVDNHLRAALAAGCANE